ncbi:tripartite tricarboxylate transporter substrate binding protein [Bordetella sp. BOR01]|uniref:Bug family tripartite tricarboxylate transporter substrate binding protein n=1 Tax=Bordetella sp. BOR01 TaxID=2854779 RepID=UPI001C45A440|nr:tripartite tricarboxylate transporter substrate binding protein [Bordetella sp. BOR01]MBV7484628.1 tripartite tricarboxylate transporter substrate binding protein [Bordetella sp. BOR01]
MKPQSTCPRYLNHPMRRLAGMLSMLSAFMLVPSAHAAGFPQEPVRILVGSQAGGGADAFSRLIAQKLQEIWGQPVMVENRTGASGSIAAEWVSKAEPNGYTVLMATPNSHTTGPHVLSFRYDPLRDFTPITQVMEVPTVLVVNKNSPANSMQQLVDLAKASPGKLNYYSSGVGSIQHLAGEMFNLQAEVKVVHVPYKGSAPAIIDVMAGSIAMGFDPVSATLGFIKSGDLKALAVAAPSRASSLPDIPTTAQAGYPGIEMQTWYGIFGPPNMPKEIVDKWQQSVAQVLAMPDVIERITAVAGEPRGSNPAEFSAFVRAEYERMGKLVTDAHIKSH